MTKIGQRFKHITARTLSLALTMLGCIAVLHAQTDERTTRAALIPLEVGNSWTYEAIAPEDDDDLRALDAPDVSKSRMKTMSISREVVLAGQRFFAMPNGFDEMFVRNGDSGVYIWHQKRAEAMLVLPYAEYAAAIRIPVAGESPADVTLVATDVSLTIAGEVYTCLHYRVSADSFVFDVFVMPGVGVVRYYLSAKDAGPGMRLDLVKRRLNALETETKSDVD